MYSKKSLISGLIINLFLISCGSNKQAYKVNDQTNVSQDVIEPVYNVDAKLGYTITRDQSYLYITLDSNEKTTQIKMLQNGISIYFDTNGKKNKDISVKYPLAKKKQTLSVEEMKDMREKNSSEEIINKRIAALGTDVLMTEEDSEYIINKEFNSENITADIDYSTEILSYTLKVPLTCVASESKIPSLGIIIKGMERPDIADRSSMGSRPSGGATGGGGMKGSGGRSGGGGMRGGGGGRSGSGGMKGSGGGGQGGERPDMSQLEDLQSDIEIWIPLDLE